MNPRSTLGLAALAAVPAAAAWAAQRRVDRQRVDRDPARAVLEAPLEGRPVPVVSADGTELHADVYGPEEAPTVVLVHGWTCAARFWTQQIQELSRDLRVVAYDLRGHGRSAPPATTDYSTEAFTADLDAVLEACLPAGQRAVVAGHSLGAMVVVAWAGARAGRVERRMAGAALVNTGVGDLVSESVILRTPAGFGRLKQAAGRTLLSVKSPLPKGSTPISSRAVRYVALGPSASPAQVAFCERMVLDSRREARAASGRTMSELDLADAVARLTVPTVVIAGERDRLTPPVHARRLAEALPDLVGADELEGVGHMAPVESPEAVSRRIRELAAGPLVATA